MDKEEQEYQQMVKLRALEEAEEKIFQQQEPIRTLNSKLIVADALQERDGQVSMKEHLKELDKRREQMFHEQLLSNVQKLEEEERRKREAEDEKKDKFRKDIKKQHKELKKTLIGKMRDEMEEGELLKYKAEIDMEEEREKERERREREVNLKIESNKINESNKALRQKQLDKEREEEARVEEYRKKNERLQEERKNREREIINEKVRQREAMYEREAEKLRGQKDRTQEIYEKQFEEVRVREENVERKKREDKEKMKGLVDEAIKLQLENKRGEREREAEELRRLDSLWNQKIQSLNHKEHSERQDIFDLNKRNQEFLKQQMEVVDLLLSKSRESERSSSAGTWRRTSRGSGREKTRTATSRGTRRSA